MVGDGNTPRVFDYESLKPDRIPTAVAAQFDPLDLARGDSLIVFCWAMVEDLEKLR